ncbi:MAG: endonuclease [Bacteroidales bacterium]|nr:endonuclease [Bacteroidales bacterium]
MNENLTIITTNSTAYSEIQHGHVLNSNVVYGPMFESFVEELEKKGIASNDIVNFREETQDILMHCNPHDAINNDETTHLVVGYVQSGKTMSFTGLTALAHDNGYRVVVYLAGTKLNLCKQTSERLEKDLNNSSSPKNRNAYKVHKDPNYDNLGEIVGHLGLSSKPTILIPILKHHDHIKQLTKIFKDEEFKDAMSNETVLIIDDEADQASLNSYGLSNSKKDEERTSSTYDAILKMRAALPGNTYIQYTATPQANILISMQDILSPKSHTLLTPGKGYIGGKLYFGKGENGDLFGGGLIKQIPNDQVFHNKRNKLQKAPKSLKDALMLHILAVAIVVKYNAKDGIDYLTMMVHPDVSKANNKMFHKWIVSDLDLWRKILQKPDTQDDKVDLLKQFEELLPTALKYYKADERPSFDVLKQYLPDILNDKKVYLINSDADADKEIDWDKYCMHILVGAEMLNRGFTVEKLATTYMPRYSVGPTNADTIQQRCRFFGYKSDYIESCSVFLPERSIEEYVSYVDHEEELRKKLSECDTLEKVEHQIMLDDRLRPTRANILPVSVVKTKLKGISQMQAFESKETILHNDVVVSKFLSNHTFDKEYLYNTEDRTHRGVKLSVEEAIDFLTDFRFKNYPDVSRKAATIRYMRYLSGLKENPLTHVYLIQMAYKSFPRERNFDFENKQLEKNTRLFAGPSSASDSTDYPGDTKIVEPDLITIQLHHIKFKGGISLDFPETAYTLAIYYPSKLSTIYRTNEGREQDDDGIKDAVNELYDDND